MTDDFEEALKEWLREQGATDRTAVDGLRAAIAALPAQRPRNRFVSIAAAAAVVLALGLAVIAVVPHSSGPALGPRPLPPDPAAFAGDPRLARCGATVENALDIFEMAHARDYRLHLPAMGLSPELDVDAPAFVVVYRDRQPFGVSGAAPPPGQTWPPAPSLAPGHHDLCVLVGSDPSTAAMNVYGDVDTAGLTVAINLTEPSLPARPSASPTRTPIAATTPEPAPIWALDLSGQLSCSGPVQNLGGEVPEGVGSGPLGATAAEALATFLGPTNFYATLPAGGYTTLHATSHWASYGHLVDGQLKAIVILSDQPPSAPAWSVAGLRACDAAEFDASVPLTFPITIWTDKSGARVSTKAVYTVPGPGHCGWEAATFLSVGDGLYFRDPQGVMSQWTKTPFDANAQLPQAAIDSGFRNGPSALWLDPGKDAYLVSTGRVERWPRSIEPQLGCA